MKTKQELHELLADNLQKELDTVINHLDGAISRAKVYTTSNNAVAYRLKILAYKADKLRDALVTTPNNGLNPTDSNFENYTLND